jgi:hypothetical protein
MTRALRLAVALSLMALGASAPAAAQSASDLVNNPHPAFPWAGFWAWTIVRPYGVAIGAFDVPAQAVTLPIAVPQPGSLPSLVELRPVVLPAYRVTETTLGFWVHAHWGVQPAVDGVYVWRWIPAYFAPR